MIQKIKNLFKVNFIKDVATLEMGKFASIGLGILSSVVFARVLHVENYGIYGLVFALAGILNILMNWGSMHATITLLSTAYAQKNKDEIKNILSYFVGLNLIKIFTLGIIFYILAPWLGNIFYHNEEIGHWARVILLVGYIDIVFSMFVIILQVSRRITKLTLIETFKKFIISTLPALLVIIGLGLFGLILGHFIVAILFLIISFVVYSIYSPRDYLLPSFKEIFINTSFKVIFKYFKFGFLIAIDKNFGNLITIVPIFLLGMFVGPEQISYFKIAVAYSSIPIMLLEPISRLLNVQLPKSKEYGDKMFRQHFFKTSVYSGLIVCIILIPLLFLASFLVKIFYGQEYLPSVSLIYYLSIMTLASSFAVGFSSLYRTLNKMNMSIILTISELFLMIVLIIVFANMFDPLKSTVIIMSFLTALFLSINFYIINKYVFKKHE
ncbi:MAG: oligosaccharide flippase family protein [Patescibacteria group bacterium]